MTTTLAEYQAASAIFALLRPEGGRMLLFRHNHITLDGHRVRAVPGAVTPLAAPDGQWTHQIALDTKDGPVSLRLTTDAAAVATLAIERWTAAAEDRRKRARRKFATPAPPADVPDVLAYVRNALDVLGAARVAEQIAPVWGYELPETALTRISRWRARIEDASGKAGKDMSSQAFAQLHAVVARMLAGR